MWPRASQVAGRLSIGDSNVPLPTPVIFDLLPGQLQTTEVGKMAFAAVRGGQFDLHGFPGASSDRAWTRLANTARAGDSNILVRGDGVGLWPVGSEIVVASSDFNGSHSEQRTVVNATRMPHGQITLTLDAPLGYRHHGTPLTYGGVTVDEVSAEVGLLTRMIKVRGPRSADKDGFGGHAGAFNTATPQTIDGVELVRLGQQGLPGRYPMHLHMSLNHSGTVIRRNSVRESYQRCIVVHGTTDAVVEDNVVFRAAGHCIMLEDGYETDVVLRSNLVVSLLPPKVMPNNSPHPRDDTNPNKKCEDCSEDDYTPTGFWVSHPSTYLIGNAVVGACDCSWCDPAIHSCELCTTYDEWDTNSVWPNVKTSINQCSGVWFKMAGGPRGPSKELKLPGFRYIDRENDVPKDSKFRKDAVRYEGNTVHSGGVGFRYYRAGWRPARQVVEAGQTLYKLYRAIFVHKNRNFVFEGYRLFDNRIGLYLDLADKMQLRDSLIVCRSELSEADGCGDKSVGVLWTGGMQSESNPGAGTYWGLPNAIVNTTFASCPSTCPAAAGGTTAVHAIVGSLHPHAGARVYLHSSPHSLLRGIAAHNVSSLFHLEPSRACGTRRDGLCATRQHDSPARQHAIWRVHDSPTLATATDAWLLPSDHFQLPALQARDICAKQSPSSSNAFACTAAPGLSDGSPNAPVVDTSGGVCFRALRVEFVPSTSTGGSLFGHLTWKLQGQDGAAAGDRLQALRPEQLWGDSIESHVLVYSLVGGSDSHYTLRLVDEAGTPVALAWAKAQLWDTRTNQEWAGLPADGDTSSAVATRACPLNLDIDHGPGGEGLFASAATFRSWDSPPLHDSGSGRSLHGMCSTVTRGDTTTQRCTAWASGVVSLTTEAPPPATLPDVSKCPNVRHDLCGALGKGEWIQNGDRLINADGTILCFTDAGDVQTLGPGGTSILQSLGLRSSHATLRMQSEGNLVYYDENIKNGKKAKWAFNNAMDAPVSGCPGHTSCFLEFALPSACDGYAGKTCTGAKVCSPSPPPPSPLPPTPEEAID